MEEMISGARYHMMVDNDHALYHVMTNDRAKSNNDHVMLNDDHVMKIMT